MLQLLFSLRILAASIELTATALSALEGAYVACHLMPIWARACSDGEGYTGSAGDTGSSSIGVQPPAVLLLHYEHLQGHTRRRVNLGDF